MPLRLPRRHLTCSTRRLRWLARALAVTGLACAPVAIVGVPAFAATATPPPGSRPAGHGAQPRTPPTAPPVRSSVSVITTDLLQDGAISAGILIALLVPIIWYGSVLRRREREAQPPGAELAESGDVRRAADPLLEYFGPQPARPASGAPRRPEPRFQPRPALAGRSTLSPAFAGRPMLPAPTAPAAPAAFGAGSRGHGQRQEQEPGPGLSGPAWPPRAAAPRAAPAHAGGHAASAAPDAWTGADSGYDAAAGEVMGLRGAGAGPRGTSFSGPGASGPLSGTGAAPTLGHALVSGAPPWGPAPRPTSELPWAVVPGPHGAARPAIGQRAAGAPAALGAPGGPAPAAPLPPVSQAPVSQPGQPGAGQPGAGPGPGRGRPARPVTRSSAPRSIFDPEPADYLGRLETQDGRRQHGDSGARPIYTWNPEGEPGLAHRIPVE